MAQRVPFTGGEKESLHTSLDRHRDVVLWSWTGSTTLIYTDR
jgi:hypothetical protein